MEHGCCVLCMFVRLTVWSWFFFFVSSPRVVCFYRFLPNLLLITWVILFFLQSYLIDEAYLLPLFRKMRKNRNLCCVTFLWFICRIFGGDYVFLTLVCMQGMRHMVENHIAKQCWQTLRLDLCYYSCASCPVLIPLARLLVAFLWCWWSSRRWSFSSRLVLLNIKSVFVLVIELNLPIPSHLWALVSCKKACSWTY